MLITNKQSDKLAAARVDFQDRNLLSDSIFTGTQFDIGPSTVHLEPEERDPPAQDDNDGGEVEGTHQEIQAEVVLACKAGKLDQFDWSEGNDVAFSEQISQKPGRSGKIHWHSYPSDPCSTLSLCPNPSGW